MEELKIEPYAHSIPMNSSKQIDPHKSGRPSTIQGLNNQSPTTNRMVSERERASYAQLRESLRDSNNSRSGNNENSNKKHRFQNQSLLLE